MAAKRMRLRAGKTLLETMWDELMSCINDLMQPDEEHEDDSSWDRARVAGRAEGVSWCIAVLEHSPAPPDIKLIKSEAMERWEREKKG